MTLDQEQRVYELRLAIESQLYELLEVGFTTDDVQEFVDGVLEEMNEEGSTE